MAKPHPALIELAARRPMPPVADGEALLASALEHRMSGVVFAGANLDEIKLPPERRTSLAVAQLDHRNLSSRQWQTLIDVMTKLDSIGVEALTFKGVSAEARWYSTAGERPASDIDLWVQPGLEGRAGDIVALLEPGHALAHEIGSIVARGIEQTVTIRFEDSFIDIHFELPALGVPVRSRNEVWARSVFLRHSSGASVRVLSAETALIQLLLHLNKDCFARLLWYSDIVRLIAQTPDLDWDYVGRFARKEGLEAPIYLTLRAVYEDLGMDVPDHPALRGWKKWLWLRLWPAKVRLQGMEGFLRRRHRRYVLAFMFSGRKLRALRWWLRQLVPTDAVLSEGYPEARGPYLWRLLVARFGRGWRNYQEARRLRAPYR